MLKEANYRQLVADWKKLSENSFWHYFMNKIESNRLDNLEHLGSGLSLTESELRNSQGKNKGFKEVQSLPDRLIKAIQEELNKIAG